MVLKVGKGGVCSGNTFRLANTRFLGRYATESCISLIEIGGTPADKTEVKKAQFLESTYVNYSLNKKGRWMLPDVIKDEIATNLQDLKCKVSMLEIHKLDRSNNCVGYYTTKGRTKKVLPRKSTYLDRQSVLKVNDKPRRCRRSNRQLRGDNHNENEADDAHPDHLPSELVYQVIVPCSMDSAVTLAKPSVINHDILLNSSYCGRTSSKSKCKRLSVSDEMSQFDESEDDTCMCCEENQTISNELGEHLNNGLASTMGDYFQQALSGKTNHKRGSHKRNTKSKKDITKRNNIRYFEEAIQLNDDNEDDETPAAYPKPASTDAVPVQIILPKNEVDYHYLQQNFPTNIHFPNCRPRKFVIEITQDVKSFLKNSNIFKTILIQKLELTSFVVFSYMKAHDSRHDVYEVHLNISTTLSCFRIETVFDGMSLKLTEVLQRILIFIETIPIESFYRKSVLEVTKTPVVQFDTIRPFVHLESTSVLLESMANTSHWSHTTEHMEFEWITVDVENMFCNICFEDISLKSSTALRECGHWFCNNCWREHLLHSFHSGLTKFTCPEYDCDKIIDEPIMITLVNSRDVFRTQRRGISSNVDSSSSQKWCPNKLCGRIIESTDDPGDTGSVVICKCGIEVCFNCSKEGHWPATCTQFAVYQNKLNAFSDHVLRTDHDSCLSIVVCGKRCPQCQIFIEKNMGCPSMMCICGCSFCWSCTIPWNQHGPTDICFNQEERIGTKRVTIRHIEEKITGNPVKSNFYAKAVDNRILRHHRHIKMVKSTADKLSCRVKAYMKKRGITSSDLGFSSPVEKLFRDIVNINIELNYVVEYCYIILDCDNDKRNRCRLRINWAAQRLRGLNDNIFQTITGDNYSNLQRTVSRIISLKETAISGIHSLVGVIRKYRKQKITTLNV